MGQCPVKSCEPPAATTTARRTEVGSIVLTPSAALQAMGGAVEAKERGSADAHHPGGPSSVLGRPERYSDGCDGQRHPSLEIHRRPIVGDDHGLIDDPWAQSGAGPFFRVIRCRSVFSGKEDEPTRGFRASRQPENGSDPVKPPFFHVVRYVERNALRANLMERAESWRWSSLRRVEREDPAFPILSTWP